MKTAFDRMKERLGPDAAEALRLDTIRLQQKALADAAVRRLDCAES
jgi:hypothetical protein